MVKYGSAFYMHIPEGQVGDLSHTDNMDQFEHHLFDSCPEKIPFFERPMGSEVKKLISNNSLKLLEIRTIDCLGHDFNSVMDILQEMTRKKVRVVCRYPSLENYNASYQESPFYRTMLQIYLELDSAEFRIKTAARSGGIQKAREQGKYKGRKKGTRESTEKFLSKPRVAAILKELGQGRTTIEISARLRCGFGTIDKVRKICKAAKKNP
jgi:DNA invertase Pin-like site-specific DNA recombinase